MTVAVVFGGVKYGPQVQGPGRRRRRAGRHARPADRPHQREARRPLGHRGAGARRGRPDARPGLPAAHPPHRRRPCPSKRQNLFFSATMPGEIGKLAAELLVDPGPRSASRPSATTVERVDQQLLFVEADRKRAAAGRTVRGSDDDPRPGLHPHQARRRPGGQVSGQAGISAAAIHGDKSPGPARTRPGGLQGRPGARPGRHRHRRPRHRRRRRQPRHQLRAAATCRRPMSTASAAPPAPAPAGIAISFCADDERGLLKDIQKLTRQTIPSFDRRNDRRWARSPRRPPPDPRPNRPCRRPSRGRRTASTARPSRTTIARTATAASPTATVAAAAEAAARVRPTAPPSLRGIPCRLRGAFRSRHPPRLRGTTGLEDQRW